VLDDDEMPAVDYRLPGLSWDELQAVLARALVSSGPVGMAVTIYNPTYDSDRSIACRWVDCLAEALTGSEG
jgi:arginase family enzyme